MALTLILTRHAKSSWSDLHLCDHDRPLNKRGRKSAEALGAWLKEQEFLPTEVISSSARRTIETWEGMSTSLPDGVLIRREPRLYHADAHTMLDCLQGATSEVVLMLGHNPGIAEFAEKIVATRPNHDRFWDYPTGATLVAQFDCDDWMQVRFGQAKALDFTVPRELTPTQ